MTLIPLGVTPDDSNLARPARAEPNSVDRTRFTSTMVLLGRLRVVGVVEPGPVLPVGVNVVGVEVGAPPGTTAAPGGVVEDVVAVSTSSTCDETDGVEAVAPLTDADAGMERVACAP